MIQDVYSSAVPLPVSVSSIMSYAVYDENNIYAAGCSAGVYEIYKLQGSVFNLIHTITGVTGTDIIINVISAEKTAIAIENESDPAINGLFMLNTETGKMK